MTSSRSKIFIFLWILLSYWFCFSAVSSSTHSDEGETILEDYLICRSCGSDAALSNFLISKLSPNSIAAGNDTLFGKQVLVQILENPLGIRFEVVTSKRTNCAPFGVWSTSYSWFPGYAWKLCLCAKCAAHLGWMFEPINTATTDQTFPSEKGFYVILLSSIISEKEVKSLLVSGYDPSPSSPHSD